MRLKFSILLIILFWLMLILRVYYLSSNEYYAGIASKNVIKTTELPPVRGQIFDVNNNPLAINRLGYSLFLKPHLKNEIIEEETKYLEELFVDLNSTKMQKEYKKQNSPYNQDFIKIVDFLEYEDISPLFSKLNLRKNLRIEPASLRFYPYNSTASHVIGYVAKANSKDLETNPLSKLTNIAGKSGVERYYNDILQGKEGKRLTKVTALNKVVEEISYTKPQSSDITLSIDMKLQEYLEDLFSDKSGAVIIMNVDNGEIVAAGSFPEYDLNPFVTGISQKDWTDLIENLDHPFTNKLINGLYPPGSVIKMSVAMAFLNSGKIDKDKSYFCGGAIELGNHKFRCWSRWGHGKMNLNDAIRQSCDIYFYEGSLEVGIDFLSSNLEKHGFGKKTGVDLPNEFIGTVPSKVWKTEKYAKPWYMGETVITSIGQGSFLVTPMQIVKNTAEIASGKGLTPHFLKKIDDNEVSFNTYEVFTPFEKQNLPYIRKAMYEVANHPKGTAYNHLKDSIVKIAAKTGTAQVVSIPQSEIVRMKEKDMEYYHRSHAWITGYAPFDNPKYAVTILVEHGGGGSSTGGPLLKNIFEKLVDMGYITINN